MSVAAAPTEFIFPHRHLLGIEGLSPADITGDGVVGVNDLLEIIASWS